MLGVDIATNLVAAGNAPAKEAGLNHLRFQEGDACALTDLKDASFDLVVTVFGAMFARRPFDVAKEMVRVTKPVGRIVMGNWIPGDHVTFERDTFVFSAPTSPSGYLTCFPRLPWANHERVRRRGIKRS